MSIRIKVFLIIMGIVLVITASSVIISVSSAQSRILETLKTKMQEMVIMANQNVTSQINKLVGDASSIASVIKNTPGSLNIYEEISYTFEGYKEEYADLMAISVFVSSGGRGASKLFGQVLSYPLNYHLPEVNGNLNALANLALEGKKAVSSSYLLSPDESVFYILLPEDPYAAEEGTNTRIVVITVNSAFFKMNKETGNVTIVDKTGKIISAVDANYKWVLEQRNFLELAKDNAEYDDAARVVRKMIDGEIGSDRFTMPDDSSGESIDNIITFMPIGASVELETFGLSEGEQAARESAMQSFDWLLEDDWALAVITPVAESSFYEIRYLLIISGLIFFGLGMIAAALASGVIAKPFELAKALAKAKTTFLSNLSHDMRTPLNVIIGFSDLSLTQRGLPNDVVQNIEEVYGTGINLLGVVNDLLDISNMESGKFGMFAGKYNLPDLINETVKNNISHIGSKPISFQIMPADNLPVRLVGDGLRIRQVFNNLLINAFNDTSEGTVEWKIATEKEGDIIWLVSSVSDTGTGIKPEDIDSVFLDYSNQDTSNMRSLKGAGLSLALTKRMTDLMDGKISVESIVGKGSVFSVRIPQKYVDDEIIHADVAEDLKKFKYIEKRRRENADLNRVQLPGKRVLIVDDGPLNLGVAKAMIEPYGILVDCVSSGQETIDLVRKAQPQYDTIFMTRMMAGMDGREIVHKIRNEIGSEYSRTVPIIALTTNTLTGNTDIFLKWGFQDVLSKPLDIHRLDRVIRRWVAGEQ
ncbi:MAG: ATP-binding protein [Treponema sp.]|nr:ATP-binding protein [Treponema sp.]